MDIDAPTPLLGGLSPAAFMRRHWQKKPLLVRGAAPDPLPEVDRSRLFALAATEGVESRLVRSDGRRWSVRQGPLARRALPALSTRGWTVLVQGVDLHDDAAHRLLARFRFVPDARLDDLMLSYASDGGGVGPHVDSYDVFLLQVAGRRRWRIGRVASPRLREDVPLKILADFFPSDEWLLEPGDMLYLPPGWGHDGIAEGGGCITASIGFRAPRAAGLAAEMLQRLAEAAAEQAADADASPLPSGADRRYRDPAEAASEHPARVPASLQAFAAAALERIVGQDRAQRRSLGEALSEPKPGTWFDASGAGRVEAGVRLDRRTRMLYDDDHVFVNGESYRAGGRDATLMRALADERRLDAESVRRLGADARALLLRWADDGWCHALEATSRRDP